MLSLLTPPCSNNSDFCVAQQMDTRYTPLCPEVSAKVYRYINPYLVTIHQLYINSHFLGIFFPIHRGIIHRIFDVYLHSLPDAMLDAGAGDTSLYISYTAIQSIQRYMAIQCIGCITPPLVASLRVADTAERTYTEIIASVPSHPSGCHRRLDRAVRKRSSIDHGCCRQLR